MKRLKIILQSNSFYYVMFSFIIIYFLVFTKLIVYHSKYNDGNISLTGKVNDVLVKDNTITFVITTEEKIKATYYVENNISISDGDVVSITGNLKAPSNNTVFNTFNYKKYLYNNKIYKTIMVKSIKIIKKSSNPFVIIKNKIKDHVRVNKYLMLFITGDKSLLEGEIYNDFKQIGVAHLLAISGMHIAIFVKILQFILKIINEHFENIIILSFLLFYAFIVGFTASVMRTFLCFVISKLCRRTNINISSLKILFLSFFLQIIINPFAIYNVGFQFSYLTSLGIIISKKFHTNKYWRDIIIITLFATLFTLPVNINLNYEINLLTLVANFMMVPLISFIIYPLSLLTFIFPFLLRIYSFITYIMEKIIIIISNIHFFTINIPKINCFFIIFYYLFLLLFIHYGYKRFFTFLIVIIGLNKIYYCLDSNYKIIIFDVNQGDSSIVISPHNKDIILIDTGGIVSFNQSGSYNVSDNIILYLKSIGIIKLSNMVITHGDFDHMGEAINLVENFKVENVIFNCGPYNDLEKELIKVLDKKKIKYYSCIKELNIDKNKLYFLQTKEYDNENDNSNVIYTELNNYKFLFMGDASVTTEKEILDKYYLPDIDVLKVGHHGSKTSSSKEFIDEINPKYSIISVGKNNRYGHPNKEVLDNLNDSKVYRTDQEGSIMFKIINKKLKIETCSP